MLGRPIIGQPKWHEPERDYLSRSMLIELNMIVFNKDTDSGH